MYAVTGICVLFGGGLILRVINGISARVFPALPLYPLPETSPEGEFWLVLSCSMLAMIAYICRSAYLDFRRNGRLVPILLLSKFCSSVLYLAFFITNGPLAYLVAFCIDGSLLLLTFALWLSAASVECLISCVDEDIIAAIGDALFPRGGAFDIGYSDFREANIDDTKKMFAAYYPHMLLGVKLMLRAFDWSPLFLIFRPTTIRRLPLEARQQLLRRIENHWFFGLRMMFTAVKLFVAMPFFNRGEAVMAVGGTSGEATP
jgi:hypothetical protein